MRDFEYVQLDFDGSNAITRLIKKAMPLKDVNHLVIDKDDNAVTQLEQLNSGHFKNTERMGNEFFIYRVEHPAVPEGERIVSSNIEVGNVVSIVNSKVVEVLSTEPIPQEDLDSSLQKELDKLVIQKSNSFNSDRASATEKGVLWDGHNWDSTQLSIGNLNAVVSVSNAGIPLPDGFTWRNKDNVNIDMTAEDMIQLAAAMLLHVNTQYKTSFALKDSVTSIAADNSKTLTRAY